MSNVNGPKGKAPTVEVVEHSLEWAMNDPDETSVTDSDNRVDMSKVLRKFRARQILPDGVEQEVVDMVRIARVQLAKEEIRAVEEDGIGGEEALASAARTAISETARKNLQEEQAVQEQARARVTEDASPLAIFNHEAHFLWHSDAARAAEPPLESALRSPASESGLWTGMIRILEHAGCRLRSGSATVPIWIWSRIWWRCVAICKRRKIAGAGRMWAAWPSRCPRSSLVHPRWQRPRTLQGQCCAT